LTQHDLPPSEVSRPTVTNYLRVLEATFVAHVVRHRRPTEIIAAPKVYGFDTGFICYYRGWQDLRDDDLGTLWEHFVLNEIMARSQSREVFYWRDKRGHEVDFVTATRRKETSSHRVQMVREQFRSYKSCCIPVPTSGRRQPRPRSRCGACLYPQLWRPTSALDGLRSFADSLSS